MSLARHVTAIEGLDRHDHHHEDGLGPTHKWRWLSYDIFAPVKATAAHPAREPAPPREAAYEVSAPRRVAQIAFAVVACCVASGVVFGFASLKPILIAEGVYGDLCPTAEKSPGNSRRYDGVLRAGSEVGIPCPEQDMRLNLFFNVGSVTVNVSSLLAGAILDRFGRRICYLAASALLAAGCFLMGYAFAIPKFDGYLTGNFFLGLGGTFLFVPSFQLANAFPRYSGLVVAMVTGAFDASAAVFLFYRMAWEASDGRFTPSRFFFGFSVVPLLILLAELSFMPRDAYHATPELEYKIAKALQDPATNDVHHSDDDTTTSGAGEPRRDSRLDRIHELVGSAEERQQRAGRKEKHRAVSGVWGVLHGLPAQKQMMTAWFILLVVLTILQMLRMNHFIATLRAQYRYMLGSEAEAEAINRFFDAALPIGGVVATPFIALLLNGLSVAATLAVLTLCIAVLGVLNCLPFLWAGYATVVSFVIFRPLYYSAMSDYATKVFGFATFGRVYGMIICVSGLCNFAQSGLDVLTYGPLKGDPTPVNAFMGVAGTISSIVLTVYVQLKTRGFREERQQDRQWQGERVPLLNGEPTDRF